MITNDEYFLQASEQLKTLVSFLEDEKRFQQLGVITNYLRNVDRIIVGLNKENEKLNYQIGVCKGFMEIAAGKNESNYQVGEISRGAKQILETHFKEVK